MVTQAQSQNLHGIIQIKRSATENSSNAGYYTDINIDEVAPIYIENLIGYPISSGTPSWDNSSRTITLDKDYSFLLVYCQKYQSYRNSQSELEAASPVFSNNGYQMPADCVFSATFSSVSRGSMEYFSNDYYFILKDVQAGSLTISNMLSTYGSYYIIFG